MKARKIIRLALARALGGMSRSLRPGPPSYRIIQASEGHTGSTVLANLLYGVLAPDAPINWNHDIQQVDGLLAKTHRMNFEKWERLNWRHKVYFVVSEREDHRRLGADYRHARNVLIIEYDSLNATPALPVEDIATRFVAELRDFLPPHVFPELDDASLAARAAERIHAMNAVVDQIADKPFSDVDPFYHVHGSHRRRNARS